MKLSILIPTHKRPKLFNRCLNSVLKQVNEINFKIEIIVNNDSDDIEEIKNPLIRYYYNKYENLSQVYEFLLNESNGEYVYFLEDDDYLTDNFFKKIDLNYDIIIGNYIPAFDKLNILKYANMYNTNIYSAKEFLSIMNRNLLQLGQHIYRKDAIMNFKFPKNGDINNDILLTEYAVENSKQIKTMNKVFFYQTQDGKDNISFPENFKVYKQYRKPDKEFGPKAAYGKSDTFRIHWDIIYICDLKCSYCYARADRNWNSITKKNQIDEIINKIKIIDKKIEIILLGGEPSLSPYYFYILDELSKINNIISLSCISNASGKVSPDWLKKHEKYKNFYFNFTFHPKETKIILFKEILKLTPKNNTIVNIMMVGDEYDNKISDIIEWCLENNIKVKPNIPFMATDISSYLYTNERYKEWIFKYIDKFEKYLYFDTNKGLLCYNDLEVYLSGQNIFKGWLCKNNNWTIGVNSTDLKRFCNGEHNGEYMECKFNACCCQGLLSNEKINTTI